METNYVMLEELLRKYHPKKRGIVSLDEVKLIKKTLHLKEMNMLELRNLRDFTVMFMDAHGKVDDYDRLSAITCCIDSQIWNLGGEI